MPAVHRSLSCSGRGESSTEPPVAPRFSHTTLADWRGRLFCALLFAHVIAACSQNSDPREQLGPNAEVLEYHPIHATDLPIRSTSTRNSPTLARYYPGLVVGHFLGASATEPEADQPLIHLQLVVTALGCNAKFAAGEIIARLVSSNRVGNRAAIRLEFGQLDAHPRVKPCLTHKGTGREVEIAVPAGELIAHDPASPPVDEFVFYFDRQDPARLGYLGQSEIRVARDRATHAWSVILPSRPTSPASTKIALFGARSQVLRWYTPAVHVDVRASQSDMQPSTRALDGVVRLAIQAKRCEDLPKSSELVLRYRSEPGSLAEFFTYEVGWIGTRPTISRLCAKPSQVAGNVEILHPRSNATAAHKEKIEWAIVSLDDVNQQDPTWRNQLIHVARSRIEVGPVSTWRESIATNAPSSSISAGTKAKRGLPSRICKLGFPASNRWLAGAKQQRAVKRLDDELQPFRKDIAGIAIDDQKKAMLIVTHDDVKTFANLAKVAKRLAPDLHVEVRRACCTREQNAEVAKLLAAAQWHPDLLDATWGMLSAPASSTYDVTFDARSSEAAFTLKRGLGDLVDVGISSDGTATFSEHPGNL